jgi:pimeloyl-ACP methyl ester carboxylesterase
MSCDNIFHIHGSTESILVMLKKWLTRAVIAALGLLLLALITGFVYEQIGRSEEVRRLPRRIGQAVNIGGRTLNLYCSGQGSPTVVFETGGNDPGYDWSLLQPKVAQFTSACWYDRAGVGWSDPPPGPRTSASVVGDLHELLGRAGVAPPYVLVGASVGGEYVRVYTSRYSQDVAGLVLLDSSHPDQREPAFMLSAFNLMSPGKRHLICTGIPFIARFGILRFIANRTRGSAPSQSPGRQEILEALNSRPIAMRVDGEQTCAATDNGRFVPANGTGNPELDNAARSAGTLGNRPLIILTAGRYWAPPGFEKDAAEYHEVWIHQLQASLARLSTHGKQQIVDAHHNMGEAPDAVVDAIQEVVSDVRAQETTTSAQSAR